MGDGPGWGGNFRRWIVYWSAPGGHPANGWGMNVGDAGERRAGAAQAGPVHRCGSARGSSGQLPHPLVHRLRPTFSCAPEDGARFVQDRIAKESDEIWAVLEAGGRVYICGDGRRMAPAVRDAFMAIYRKHTGAGGDEAGAWLNALIESGQYVEDVWAG